MSRPRRLRIHESIRKLVAENQLNVNDLVYPLFIKSGNSVKEAIPSMPGQFRYSADSVLKEMEKVSKAGINSVLLFGLTDNKDEKGLEAVNAKGALQKSISNIKKEFPDIFVMTDVCVCGYTSHGHCGLIRDGYVDNDSTLQMLSQMALSHAEAGADMLAPSAMMDKQVEVIRKTLDGSGFTNTGIMAYSAKYLSSFYGPFRDAANSAPQFGDRASYQMNPPNSKEAMLEMELDISEGADIIMVKPALAYLDIIHQAHLKFNLPIAAYNVSGEYSMIKAASEKGWLDENKAAMEMLMAIKRAGASIIITYFAKQAAGILAEF